MCADLTCPPPAQAEQDEGFVQFIEALAAEKDGMPAEAYEQIMTAMHSRHAKPPLEALEAVLGIPMSIDKARQLLFYPSDEDMQLYVKLLAAPQEGSPEAQGKMQVLGLTLLYLVHSRCWVRLRPFIEAGGLMCIVDLLADANLYLASQAMQVLLHATDEEMYAWHDPHGDGTPVKKDEPEALLWSRMFQLSKSPLFANLLKHQNPDTFPGSALLALRLLAFFMSWLRYHFTPNRVLRLSADLLDLLRHWSARSGLNEEEKMLATQLYQDFSRYPPAVVDGAPQLGTRPDTTTLEQDELEVHVVQDKSMVNHVEPSEAELLRQAGNEAYRKGDFSTAIRHYSAALDVPVPAAELLEEGPRRATLLSNRAAAYLARVAEAGGKPGTIDDTGLLEGYELGTREAQRKHYEAALIDAQGALDLVPTHVKALYRKSQALYWQGSYQPALECCQEALKQARYQGSADTKAKSMESEVAALCEEIQRCMATPGSSSQQDALDELKAVGNKAKSKPAQEEYGPHQPEMLNVLGKAASQQQPDSKVAGRSDKKGPLIQEVVAFEDGALGKACVVGSAVDVAADFLVPAVHATSEKRDGYDLDEMD